MHRLIRGALDDWGLSRRFDEVQAASTWRTIAGPAVNRVTERIWVAQGRLHVRLNSGPWRLELHLHRHQWCDRLNTELGRHVIHEIIFR